MNGNSLFKSFIIHLLQFKINLLKNKESVSYVSLTIATTFISFFKGFILMRYLSLHDLGIITLISAVMGLFVMLQLGFLNGGYRIYSEQHKDSKDVNNIIYTYFFIIEVLLIFGIILFYFLNRIDSIELFYALSSSFFGILLVLNNSIRNILIANKKVTEVNRLNLISTITSFIFLFTVPFWGLYGALLVTFSIELIFYSMAIIRDKSLLPTNFNFNIKQYKWVLSYGFLPFIAGVIITYNAQIETWSIAKFISTDALGEFYLPKLYISLFLLIPNAVAQLFFPDAIKAYSESNFIKVKNIIKKYVLINTVVGLFLCIITVLLMPTVIKFVVPLHLVGIPYVWIILPGLFIYTILRPLDLVFYASNILRPFILISIIGVIFTTCGLLTYGFFGTLTLVYVAIIKSLFYVIISLSLVGFYFYKKKLIWQSNNLNATTLIIKK